MACRSWRTDRRGLSAVEALIGIVLASFLLGVAYWGLSAGLRLLSRGESKLHATGQSELVLRRLRADLDAAVQPPAVEDERITIRTGVAEIAWSFRATTNGRGSVIERVAGETSRYLAGALTRAKLVLDETGGRRSIAVALGSRGTHDAVAGEFGATFFVRGAHDEPTWNTLGD